MGPPFGLALTGCAGSRARRQNDRGCPRTDRFGAWGLAPRGLVRRDLMALASAERLPARRPPPSRGLGRAGRRAGAAARAGRRARGGPAAAACPGEGEDIVADYRALGFTLARHPLALLRPRLAGDGWLTAAEVAGLTDGAPVRTGGIVVTRQRPGSAGGVIFVTLEDETGYVNLVVWSRIADAHRKAMLGARLLGVRGRLQREGEVRHVVVDALEDRSALLGSLVAKARSFR